MRKTRDTRRKKKREKDRCVRTRRMRCDVRKPDSFNFRPLQREDLVDGWSLPQMEFITNAEARGPGGWCRDWGVRTVIWRDKLLGYDVRVA